MAQPSKYDDDQTQHNALAMIKLLETIAELLNCNYNVESDDVQILDLSTYKIIINLGLPTNRPTNGIYIILSNYKENDDETHEDDAFMIRTIREIQRRDPAYIGIVCITDAAIHTTIQPYRMACTPKIQSIALDSNIRNHAEHVIAIVTDFLQNAK